MNALKRIRLERRKTRAQLAELAGVSYFTIRNIEEGRNAASEATAFKLADALECEPGEILEDAAAPERPAA